MSTSWPWSVTERWSQPIRCRPRSPRRRRWSPATLGLVPNWLNAGPTSLLELGLPAGLAGRLIARDFGPALRVSFASRIDQIFFNPAALGAGRDPRDFADLRALQPTADELRAAARWARTHNMPGPFDDAIARTLTELGVQDDGRDA